jgi:hypothetical protein
MNTLEWMPLFLPSLWLFAMYLGDASAAALGAIWIVGRILYWNVTASRQQTQHGICGPGARLLRAVVGRARRDRVGDGAYVSERIRFHSPRIIPGSITRLGSQCRCSIMIDQINATRRRVEPRAALVALRCPARRLSGGRGDQWRRSRGHNTVIAAAIVAAKSSAAVLPCRFDQQTDAQRAGFLRR